MAGAEGRARVAEVAARTGVVALTGEHVLALLPALEPLAPEGLRRGSTVSVGGGPGSTSLALALLAGPSSAGSWAAVMGLPTLGLAAAAGFGVALERLVMVAQPPPPSWATVLATLVDAFDVVLARPLRRVGAGDARRLVARVRERGSVLVVAGEAGWPEAPDLCLRTVAADWEGLGDGHGHLRARRVTVEASGRRAAARTWRVELWLPAPGGAVEAVAAVAAEQGPVEQAPVAQGPQAAPAAPSPVRPLTRRAS